MQVTHDRPVPPPPPKDDLDAEVEVARREARELLAEFGVDLDATPSGDNHRGTAARKRGGQPGNKNALKHGRRSAVIRRTKAVVGDITRSLGDEAGLYNPRRLPDSYLRAIRWSDDERAALQIAVLRRAEYLRWRLGVVDALRAHRPLPAPPATLPTAREDGIYNLYVEQRRILHFSAARNASDTGPDGHAARLARNIQVALRELESWQLASECLSPEAQAAAGINLPVRLRELRALSHASEPQRPPAPQSAPTMSPGLSP
ncbi:MAG: hypothetical protein GEU28_11485 [Dehalococcoidia bacterium]|nr:hypothetical protein [Dehalococcoidia bacterium]